MMFESDWQAKQHELHPTIVATDKLVGTPHHFILAFLAQEPVSLSILMNVLFSLIDLGAWAIVQLLANLRATLRPPIMKSKIAAYICFRLNKPIYIESLLWSFIPFRAGGIIIVGIKRAQGLSWYRGVSNLKRFEILMLDYFFSLTIWRLNCGFTTRSSTSHCRSAVSQKLRMHGYHSFFYPLRRARYSRLNLLWTSVWLIKPVHHSRILIHT